MLYPTLTLKSFIFEQFNYMPPLNHCQDNVSSIFFMQTYYLHKNNPEQLSRVVIKRLLTLTELQHAENTASLNLLSLPVSYRELPRTLQDHGRQRYKLKLYKIAARWPAKAVAQFFYFFKNRQ